MTAEAQTRVEPHDHVVLFYQDDNQLVTTVAQHLMEGLTSGESAVVVATSAHIEAFESAMLRSGIDVAAARRNENLLTIDADEALSRFLVGHWPDAEAFDTEVGSLIRYHAEFGHRVRVYGEMVALLWDAGHVTAAIELEDMWNQLGRRVPFSLLCAYPAQSVSGDDRDSFHRLCHAHSAVSGVVRADVSRSFIGESGTLRAVRQFVVDTLQSWGLARCVDDASMMVSELATNAIIHARSDFVVSVASRDDAVRVSVRDSSHSLPVLRNPPPLTISGRGLVLIAALARRWGVEPLGDGKAVWVELNV